MPEPRTRVLLVEDNSGLRETTADILLDAGMEVQTASDMPSALSALEDDPYDVAVVDLVLPGPSGVEFIRKLKSISPATRIIACTAYYGSDLLVEAQALGIDQTVYKPADPAALIALVKKLAGIPAD